MNIARKLIVLVILLSGSLLIPTLTASAKDKEPPARLSGADREYRNTLFALGDRQLESGQTNEALETFTQLLERFPKDAVLFTRIGHVYLKKQ